MVIIPVLTLVILVDQGIHNLPTWAEAKDEIRQRSFPRHSGMIPKNAFLCQPSFHFNHVSRQLPVIKQNKTGSLNVSKKTSQTTGMPCQYLDLALARQNQGQRLLYLSGHMQFKTGIALPIDLAQLLTILITR